MAVRRVEGTPYSAEFIDIPYSSDDPHCSMAYAIIQPPLNLEQASGLIDDHTYGPMDVENYATTQTRTVLRFTVEEVEDTLYRASHEQRIANAYKTLTDAVATLNMIEQGTFKQEYKGE